MVGSLVSVVLATATESVKQEVEGGQDVFAGEGGAAREIQSTAVQPLPDMWAAARFLPPFSVVPSLPARSRPQGTDPRPHQGELVGVDHDDRSDR